MGGSGSGKTTLLTIIAGHEQCATGTISLDGHRYNEGTGSFIGFVPQSERFFSTLTVGETLVFASKLRGAHATSEEKIEQQVDRLLNELELSHVKNTRIGDPDAARRQGLSGGERKRTAIATEVPWDSSSVAPRVSESRPSLLVARLPSFVLSFLSWCTRHLCWCSTSLPPGSTRVPQLR